MCNITILEIEGNVDSFNCIFTDCENNNGQFQFELQKELPQNQAGHYIYSGSSTDGAETTGSVIVPNTMRINPTKVFNYVVKKLKEILCPTCT